MEFNRETQKIIKGEVNDTIIYFKVYFTIEEGNLFWVLKRINAQELQTK